MSSDNTAGSDGRRRILDAAREVFAKKGFDGARVDEIAKAAKANKALLYYYFDSKEKLLTELIRENVDELIAFKDKYLKDLQVDSIETDGYKKAIDKLLKLLESKKDILSIIIIEGLKESAEDYSVFQFMDPVMKDSLERVRKMGFTNVDDWRFCLFSIFVGLIPIMMFMTLKDKWAEYYGYDKDEAMAEFAGFLKEHFIYALVDILDHYDKDDANSPEDKR
jgi:AcrR family transcriptional regulator